MSKRHLPLSKVSATLGAGAVVLLATAHRGRANVMPLAWLTMLDFDPPLVGLVMGDRNYSFAALKTTRACTLNVPTVEIARQTVDCGVVSGAEINKFAKFGLTPIPAARVRAPLVKECPLNFECRVVDMGMVKKYDLFVLEVVKAWIDFPAPKRLETIHHLGGERFMVAGPTIRLRTRAK